MKIDRVVPFRGIDPKTYRFKVINQYGAVKIGQPRPSEKNATDEALAKFPKATYIEIQSRICGHYVTEAIIRS